MTVTVHDLAAHLKLVMTPANTEPLDRVLMAARGVILPALTIPAEPTDEQVAVIDLAVLTVAQDLCRRQDAAGGTYLFADATDITGFLPRDQLQTVMPMLMEAGLMIPVIA